MLGDALVSGVVAQDVGEGKPEALLDFGDLVLAVTVERAPEGPTVTDVFGGASGVEQLLRATNVTNLASQCSRRRDKLNTTI